MYPNSIAVSQLKGGNRMWHYADEYELLDGSSWKLDGFEEARQYNRNASLKERSQRGNLSLPFAWMFKSKDRFFLKIEPRGRKRQVIPVHLPDPDRYHNPKRVKRGNAST